MTATVSTYDPALVAAAATYDYELARAISILRSAHYSNCHTTGTDGHFWSEQCPVFVAWDRRRSKLGDPISLLEAKP